MRLLPSSFIGMTRLQNISPRAVEPQDHLLRLSQFVSIDKGDPLLHMSDLGRRLRGGVTLCVDDVTYWHIASVRWAAEFGRYRGIARSANPSTAVTGRHDRRFFWAGAGWLALRAAFLEGGPLDPLALASAPQGRLTTSTVDQPAWNGADRYRSRAAILAPGLRGHAEPLSGRAATGSISKGLSIPKYFEWGRYSAMTRDLVLA
jgi:hypothetical protein